MKISVEEFFRRWNLALYGSEKAPYEENPDHFKRETLDGQQTFDFAESHKHDVDKMLECCRAETENFRKTGIIGGPYYFWRVAVLAKKAKNYELEIRICENYLEQVELYYKKHGFNPIIPGIIASPRVADMKKRLPKARANLAKQRAAKIDGGKGGS